MKTENTLFFDPRSLQRMLDLSLTDLASLLMVSKSMVSMLLSRQRTTGGNTARFFSGLRSAVKDRMKTVPSNEEIIQMYQLPDTLPQAKALRIAQIKAEIAEWESRGKMAEMLTKEKLQGLYALDGLVLPDEVASSKLRSEKIAFFRNQVMVRMATVDMSAPLLIEARLAGLAAELDYLESATSAKATT